MDKFWVNPESNEANGVKWKLSVRDTLMAAVMLVILFGLILVAVFNADIVAPIIFG